MPALKQKTKSEGGVQAVALALQVIEALAFAGKPQSVTELAKNLGTTKTRIFNYLRTLVEHGYAVQDPETERYRVGFRVSQIGDAVANEFDLLSVSRAPMRRIREAFGQTVVLCKFDGAVIYCIAQFEGVSPLKVSIAVGFVMGFHSSAQGKLALAFGPGGLLENTIEKGLPALTEATITDPDRLRKEIETIHARGWATASNETMMMVDTLAVPVLDKRNLLLGTIAIVALAEELADKQSLEQKIAVLKEAAAEISSRVADTR